jgi:hypothetical protein
MFCCCLCQLCSIQNRMGRYELIQMVDREWHVFQWTKGVQTFYGKGPQPSLWAGSWVAHGKLTSCVLHELNYYGLCPWVGDPCRKWNCTLNWSLGTLQLSRAPLIVTSFCSCVITCAVQMPYRGMWKWKISTCSRLFITQRNSEFWGKLFSALCHVCAYYARVKTAHKLGYLYIYWRVILCGSVLVVTMFEPSVT